MDNYIDFFLNKKGPIHDVQYNCPYFQKRLKSIVDEDAKKLYFLQEKILFLSNGALLLSLTVPKTVMNQMAILRKTVDRLTKRKKKKTQQKKKMIHVLRIISSG